MTKNMGNVDRTIRIIAALVIAWLYFSARITGTLGIILLLVAIMFVVTSFFSRCPGYLPFGFSTRRGQDGPSA